MASPSGSSRPARAHHADRSYQQADVLRLADRYRAAILAELHSALDQRTAPPFTLMRYHLGWEDRHGRAIEPRAGKLLRPTLCLLCCEAVGGDWRRALPAAAALELLHNFTLIHDDVEDASRQRRGRETLWSLWGAAQAINVGDGMFALAHLTLLRLEGCPAEQVLRAARMLDEATLRLCEGQHRDLTCAGERQVSRDDYLAMIEGKTAALLAASCGIGALLGGGNERVVDSLHEFGLRLGLAFQIRDDALDVWGDPQETGKPIGDDLRAGKRSFPVVVALERASARERSAFQALLGQEGLDEDGLGRACALLERLGAREESERAAQEHAEAAIAGLAGLSLRPQHRRELERLARFAAQRRS